MSTLMNLKSYGMYPNLPFDSVVEYLESTGTQCINTNTIDDPVNNIAQITFSIPTSTGATMNLFGSSGARFNYVSTRWGSNRYNFGPATTTTSVLPVSIVDIHVGTYTLTNNELTYTLDDVSAVYSSSLVFNNLPLGIFYIYGRLDASPFIGRVYGFKVIRKSDGTVIMDLIPVRKGNVGALYDRRGVGGMNSDGSPRNDGMYFNQGTGDFLYGNDIVPVEYIESHGTEWINIYTFTGSETSLRYNIDFVITQDSSSTQDFVLGVSSLGNIGPRLARYSNVFCYSCDSGNVVFGQAASLNQRYNIDFTYNSDGTIDSSINGGAISTYQGAFYSSQGSSNYLFGMVGNSIYGMIGRVYRMKMWADSTSVRSFLPIRIGSNSTWEGAMMDTLTRRIYRNQGTGTFGYGKDLKYPLI